MANGAMVPSPSLGADQVDGDIDITVAFQVSFVARFYFQLEVVVASTEL